MIICCNFCLAIHAQKIQYTRQTFPTTNADVMQLVADVAGYHHLLSFSAKQQPVVHIFDSELQLDSKKEIDLKQMENYDIRIIPFANYYYLYLHTPNSTRHELFKIDGKGNIKPLSKVFADLIQKEFTKSLATLQLVNQEEHLYIISHRFYPSIRKVGTSVVQLDSALSPVHERKVFFPFTRGSHLQDSRLMQNTILVLKSTKSDETGNDLEIFKIDLNTGKSIVNKFSSELHVYINPGFTYNSKDSSILVYSLVREPFDSKKKVETIFISKLDNLLFEQEPVTLLKSQFKNNTLANFLYINGKNPYWLNMNLNSQLKRPGSIVMTSGRPRLNEITRPPGIFWAESNSNIQSINQAEYYRSTYATEGEILNARDATSANTSQPGAVRFSVLNEKFEIINDSLVKNKNEKFIRVQAWPYAQFNMNNRAYLVLVQNFTPKTKGLLMVSSDDNGELSHTDIRIYDKYDFMLSKLKAVADEYFIVPYTYKNEIGLVKITMN